MQTFQIRLQQKLQSTFSTEPNNLGINYLNILYKRSTHYLKSLPFVLVIPLSFLAAVLTYLVVGQLVVRLTSLLQYGF